MQSLHGSFYHLQCWLPAHKGETVEHGDMILPVMDLPFIWAKEEWTCPFMWTKENNHC